MSTLSRRSSTRIGAVVLCVAAASCGLDSSGLAPGAASSSSASASSSTSTSSSSSSSSSSATSSVSAASVASSASTGTGGGGEGGAGGGIGGAGGAGPGGGGAGGGAPVCGDGATDPGETCDDGNTTSGDGCSSTCTFDASDVCGSPTEIPVGDTPVTIDGTTVGAMPDHDSLCFGFGSDVVYAIEATASGTMVVTMSGRFQKVLHARATCDDLTELDCSGDSGGEEEIRFPVTLGSTYYVIADGYGNMEGAFTLTLEVQFCGDGTANLNEECDDGVDVDDDGCNAACEVECGTIPGTAKRPGTFHCYTPPLGGTETWDEAVQACGGLGPGWSLLAVDSQGELTYVDGNVGPSDGTPVWIGGKDDGSSVFTWSNGEPWTYENWAMGEPTVGAQDCVVLEGVMGALDEFYDRVCSNTNAYLCERTPP